MTLSQYRLFGRRLYTQVASFFFFLRFRHPPRSPLFPPPPLFRSPNRGGAGAFAAAAGGTQDSVGRGGYARPGHDRRYAVDCTRARELGWSPRVDFEQGVERTV